MPTGLPDPWNTAESARSAICVLLERIHDAAEYLCIPSYAEYSVSARDAYFDMIRASKSSWHLFHLTFRPLFIFVALLGRYVAIALKILAECTIKHGIVAAREGAGQAGTAAKWFAAWQRSLSHGAILAELGAIAAAVGIYLLRRHIRRKRYVERVKTWSERKKARALRRYNIFVAKVSKTSTFLAMLLPHSLYICLVAICKYLMPWLLRYFATKTYLMALVSLWIPFVKTVMVIHRWVGIVQEEEREKTTKDGSGSESQKNGEIRNGFGSGGDATSARFRGKRSSNVAERYLKATEQSSALSGRYPARQSDEIVPKRDELVEDSLAQLCDEAMGLLKYWVVYALILSFFRMASMLPIVGRFIAVEDPSKITATATRFRRWPGESETNGFWSSMKLSYHFVEEAKLVFFLWLRYLPTSLTAVSHESNTVQKKAALWGKKSIDGSQEAPSNIPLDILYQQLAPIAVAAADSSSNLSQATDSDTGVKGLLHTGMKFIRSFLQMAVFMKIISDPTKTWIESTLVECSALLPAAITLLMPGYFTEFGCIYVCNVVPSANSATAIGAKKTKCTSNNHTIMATDLSPGMRFLKYWVVHRLLSVLLSSFAPILNWVPLSTHATWLLWAYTQLESPTNRIYAIFEWELKAFGLLHRHSDDSEDMEFSQTVTATLIRKFSSALPSASSNGVAEKENVEAEPVERVKQDLTSEGLVTLGENSDEVKQSQKFATDTNDKRSPNPSINANTGSTDEEDDSVGTRRREVTQNSRHADGVMGSDLGDSSDSQTDTFGARSRTTTTGVSRNDSKSKTE